MNEKSFEVQNESLVEKANELNFKRPIIVLSSIALIFYIINVICGFFGVYIDENGKVEILSFFGGEFALSNMLYIFKQLLFVLPFVLFLIYVLKFYNDLDRSFLIPAIFGIQAIQQASSLNTFWNVITFVMCLILFVGAFLKKYNRKIIIISSAIIFAIDFFEIM